MTAHHSNPETPPTTEESFEQRAARFRQFLEQDIWPHIPAELLGKPISKAETEEILGLGPDGV
jgi:antitoxin VapB